MTGAERKLWAALRGKQLGGLRFRRQHPIGVYVVDFVCLERRLVIEVDGGQHGETGQTAFDQQRTDWLRAEGYRVLRFWNREVSLSRDDCLTAIWAELGTSSEPQDTPTDAALAFLLNRKKPNRVFLPPRGGGDKNRRTSN